MSAIFLQPRVCLHATPGARLTLDPHRGRKKKSWGYLGTANTDSYLHRQAHATDQRLSPGSLRSSVLESRFLCELHSWGQPEVQLEILKLFGVAESGGRGKNVVKNMDERDWGGLFVFPS